MALATTEMFVTSRFFAMAINQSGITMETMNINTDHREISKTYFTSNLTGWTHYPFVVILLISLINFLSSL